MTLFGRIREGLARTTQQIVGRFDEIASRADDPDHRGQPVDAETADALEELLISADVGVAASERIIEAVKARAPQGGSLRDLVKEELRAVFAEASAPAGDGHSPHVVLIVGVNGTGKTTTVGKLANLARSSGETPLICAADTFRAAAVEQLEIWARRARSTSSARARAATRRPSSSTRCRRPRPAVGARCSWTRRDACTPA
jgi:fused signal recognition particle receptor